MSKPLKSVTKTNPCPHCGKPDWCYSIGNLSVCNRDNLPTDGWYQTGKKDQDGHYYYAPIQDLPEKQPRQSQTRTWEYLDRSGNKLVRVVRIDKYHPTLINPPQKIIWQEYWLESPQLAIARTEDCWVKLSQKDYDNGKCTQAEWDLFNELKNKLRQHIPIYRYQEIQQAITEDKIIFIVEGESCADALWKLGIPATTNIGGSKKWRSVHSQDLFLEGRGQRAEGRRLTVERQTIDFQPVNTTGNNDTPINTLNEKGNKEINLTQCQENNLLLSNSCPQPLIVLCPDRDKPGIEHMERIYQDFPSAQWLYAFPQSPLWNVNLPLSDGLDIADWIDELKNSYGLSDEQIKETIFHSVENQSRHFQTHQEVRNQSSELRTTGANSYNMNFSELGNNNNCEFQTQLNDNTRNNSEANNSQLQTQLNENVCNNPELNNNHLDTCTERLVLSEVACTERSRSEVNRSVAPCSLPFNTMSTKSVNSTRNNQSQFNQGSQQTTEEFNDKQLIIELEQLIDNSPKESVLTTMFNKLSRLIGLPITEVRKLFGNLIKESDKSAELSIRQDEINQLLKLESDYFDLSKYLPIEMVNPLNQIAEVLGSNSIAQLTALLPVVASLINPQTKLTLIQSSKFVARPIFYSAVVGESGSSKSPTMDIFTAPLIQHIQQKAEYKYQQALAEYERIKADKTVEEKPPKPKPLEYYVTDATSECIAQIINDQPNKGFLMLFDELSGLIKQNNAYRGGKGADQEKILSGRDGTGWKVNRKNGDRFNNARSTYSILGAMTPDVLRQQMGSCQDESGYWARFVYASLPLKKCKFPDDETKFDIYPLLCGLYENIESLPAYQYHLCQEGSKIYQQFFDEMEHLKLNEPNQALRAVYSKFKRVAGEIALLLQSLHKAFYHNVGNVDSINMLLEPKFMAMGVELANRYIKEIKSIYLKHEGSNEQNLSPIYSKIISLSQRKGWLKARDLKQCDRHFRNLLTIDIRRHFQDLISLGFGEVRGIGKHLEWRFNKNSVPNSQLNQTQNSQLTTHNWENSEQANNHLPSAICHLSSTVDNKMSELPNYLVNGESYSYSYQQPSINEKVVNVDTLSNLELETENSSELKTQNNSEDEKMLSSAFEQLKIQNSELINKNLELTTNLSELKTENLELTTNLSELKINFSQLRNQNLELISEIKELRNSVNSIMIQINSDSSQSQSLIIEEIKSSIYISEIESINNKSESNLNTDSTEYPLSNESLSIFEPMSISDQTDILSSVNSPKNDELSIEQVLNKYEGLYARVPVEYAKSGILVDLSEGHGYLFGHESGMTKTVKVPLFQVIEYKQDAVQ